MGQELICAWLQLPNESWPPDHYTLLGLEPGEPDIARIEQQVYVRMEKVRVYQLPHPELATEAMNRLAQALICLTDPHAKLAYDQKLLPERFPAPALPARQAPATNTSLAWLFGSASPDTGETERPGEPQTILDWETTPPPQRQPAHSDDVTVVSSSEETVQIGPGGLPARPPAGAGETSTPQAGAAQRPSMSASSSANWRKGLGTRRALHDRIVWHRQLLYAWQSAGKYLNRPTRAVHRPAEATDLIHHMQSIRELLGAFPLFGVSGPPGFLVMALASQQMIVPTLQTLLSSQREALARDWQAGLKLLLAYRQFLRQELQASKRRSSWRQGIRACITTLVEHPGLVVLLIAGVALNLAYEPIFRHWPEQLIGLLALLAIRMAFWNRSRPTIRRQTKQQTPPPAASRTTTRRPRKMSNSSRA